MHVKHFAFYVSPFKPPIFCGMLRTLLHNQVQLHKVPVLLFVRWLVPSGRAWSYHIFQLDLNLSVDLGHLKQRVPCGSSRAQVSHLCHVQVTEIKPCRAETTLFIEYLRRDNGPWQRDSEDLTALLGRHLANTNTQAAVGGKNVRTLAVLTQFWFTEWVWVSSEPPPLGHTAL